MLKRLETSRLTTIGPARAELVEKASRLFGGYSDRRSSDSLKEALNVLQIAPIDPATVRNYKRSKEVHKRIYTPGRQVAGVIAVAAAAAFVVTTVRPALLYHTVPGSDWPGTRVIGLIACIVTFLAMLAFRFDGDKHYLKRTWVFESITSFGVEYVPDFALDRAIRIKELCPSAEFHIEHLREEHEFIRRPRWEADPFLVAKLGAERFYVDVWDEYDFERKV